MKETIMKTLEEIEKRNHIRILYAVESGSRAWGFASPDSDYDVRYVFVRPLSDYLRIDPLKETVEGPLDDVLDFTGWDIRKTLELLRKTNPSLMEWLGSPIVYRTTPEWEALREKFPRFFNPYANIQHYVSMMDKNFKTYIRNQEKVKLKRYLYVLRPLLCCLWLERFGTVPPVPFDVLREAVLPEEMKETVEDLLERKKKTAETDLTDPIPELDAFILAHLPRLKDGKFQVERTCIPEAEPFNEMFREILEKTRDQF